MAATELIDFQTAVQPGPPGVLSPVPSPNPASSSKISVWTSQYDRRTRAAAITLSDVVPAAVKPHSLWVRQ